MCIRMLGIFCIVFTLLGCQTSPSVQADNLAKKAAFSRKLIHTQDFNLTCYHKKFQAQKPLTIYIEGDGHTWISKQVLSKDPTPHQPLALKLALLDERANVVYLARPCQYSDLSQEKNCHPDIWSFKRFSEPVIFNMNEAIEKLKTSTQAKDIHLVGFSGGAAIAILIAARRQDVKSIKTVAGDLDHEMMTNHHQTTPLIDCLNPKHVAAHIAHIPQWHFVGAEDPIVPSFITQSFVSIVAKSHPASVHFQIFPNISHHQGWEKKWPELCSSSAL